MINLYLTKNVNNEELESLETSYFSRNLANVIVNSLVSASDISLLYSRHLIYLEIEDKDILDENIVKRYR
jgi:DNA phosphorothioation-dependent restriction protein DptG